MTLPPHVLTVKMDSFAIHGLAFLTLQPPAIRCPCEKVRELTIITYLSNQKYKNNVIIQPTNDFEPERDTDGDWSIQWQLIHEITV